VVDVRDVGQYILEKQGGMTTWKLQKLVYYCQAWSLVWDDEPLFDDDIEAWANGPVVRRLYDIHVGHFRISKIKGGDPTRLNPEQRETIEAVLETYGDKSPQWLSNLTHCEAPWRDTRRLAGLSEGERGNAVIPLDAMAEYCGGLGAKG
jgi:uncharacterized phage-associated protein